MHVFRQVLFHLLHTLVYRIRNLNMVSSRLWNNNDTYHRNTVHFHITLDVGRSQFGTSDITETDNTVILFFDNQIIEFICGMHQSQCTDSQLGGISFDTTGRKFHILIVYGVFNVDRSDSVAGHFNRVEPETHGVTLFSPDRYTTYIGNGL